MAMSKLINLLFLFALPLTASGKLIFKILDLEKVSGSGKKLFAMASFDGKYQNLQSNFYILPFSPRYDLCALKLHIRTHTHTHNTHTVMDKAMAIGEISDWPKKYETFTLKRRLRMLMICLDVYHTRSFVDVQKSKCMVFGRKKRQKFQTF